MLDSTGLDVMFCNFDYYIWYIILLDTIGAISISQALMVNQTLLELNMVDNDIGDNGISVITEGLQSNKTLAILNVWGCRLSVEGRYKLVCGNYKCVFHFVYYLC